MPGLDRAVLDSVEPESVFRRICVDLRTDFIVAPHYFFIFENASAELWERLYKQLKSGTYEPELPLTIAVPKPGGFTRPGSILHPFDRVIYHALTELAAPQLEASLDRNRVFSHVWLPYEAGDQMFKPEQECWEALRSKLTGLAQNGGYFVKADVAHYFERIPQHDLINLIRASDCLPGVVNLLEELLLAFRERNSYGIVQGIFPSDLLGNFFLSRTDAHFDLLDVESARFVDDIYLYYKSKSRAQKGMFELTEHLRQNGLNLNENKSGVISAAVLIRDENCAGPAILPST
jgi:hypothetical protein